MSRLFATVLLLSALTLGNAAPAGTKSTTSDDFTFVDDYGTYESQKDMDSVAEQKSEGIKEFACPKDQYIKSINVTRTENVITGISFGCNEGWKSPYYGTIGDVSQQLFFEGGISEVGYHSDVDPVNSKAPRAISGMVINDFQVGTIGPNKMENYTGSKAWKVDVKYTQKKLTALKFDFRDGPINSSLTLTAGPIGASTGKEFYFRCSDDSYVTRFEGKSGDVINSLRVHCSNGAMSELFGTNSGDKDYNIEFPNGFVDADIFASDYVYGFQFYKTETDKPLAGTEAKDKNSLHFSPSDQLIHGISGTYEDKVNSLAFLYKKFRSVDGRPARGGEGRQQVITPVVPEPRPQLVNPVVPESRQQFVTPVEPESRQKLVN